MSILKLKPACKDYLWGGRRLADEFGIEYGGERLAEAWELSCHPDGSSIVAEGKYAGLTFPEYIKKEGKQVLGINCRRFREFPILIKFIDAKDNLSVQVHPGNRYALRNEGQYGKTEMWYVIDAKEGAKLYYGFKKKISKEEFRERIENGTLLDVLNEVSVRRGDVLFIESGTIHAIGKDILIAEIQQNSNVTYRVYDYGREDANGHKRDLHIEKALAVTNTIPVQRNNSSYPHIADCDYFTVDKLNLDGHIMDSMEGKVSEISFLSILVLDGSGRITCGGDTVEYRKGDSLFIPAGSGKYEIKGRIDALLTSVREKAGPIRIGVDIGGRHTKIGIVDAQQNFLDYRETDFDESITPEETVKQTAQTILKMLEDAQIDVDQCVGIGVGVAGTIKGNETVKYSNNLKWKDVNVAGIVGEVIKVPVIVANNADCAVLGETAAGAARDYSDVVMLTIGRGVGSGVIINGKIYSGLSGSRPELGHMVVSGDGRRCSCGRCGCLETYVSATAVREETLARLGREMEINEVLELASESDKCKAEGDDAMADRADACIAADIARRYIGSLTDGIVNIINIYRPQALILGGNISEIGDNWYNELKVAAISQSFGCDSDSVPEIHRAKFGRKSGVMGAANSM